MNHAPTAAPGHGAPIDTLPKAQEAAAKAVSEAFLGIRFAGEGLKDGTAHRIAQTLAWAASELVADAWNDEHPDRGEAHELRGLWHANDRLRAENRELTEKLEASARQQEAIEPHAARYFWLRDHSDPPHQFYLSVPIEFKDVKFSVEEVDSYIDRAIAARSTPTPAPGPSPAQGAVSTTTPTPAQAQAPAQAPAQGTAPASPAQATAQAATADVFDVGTPATVQPLLGEFAQQARESMSWNFCARTLIGVENPDHALLGLYAMAARGEYLLSELTQAQADLAALSAELVALRNDNAAWSSLSRFIVPVNPETAALALETQQEDLERQKKELEHLKASGNAVGYAVLQKGRDPVFHMGAQGRGRAKAGALRASRGAEDNGQMPRVFALVPVGRVTRAVVWVEGMTA